MSPPSLAIAPADLLSANHRLLRLPNPRNGLASLYLVESSGARRVLEVQQISPEAERSWFVGQEVVQDGRLLVFSPIDPVFLILPIVHATTSNPSRFLLSDHLFSTAASLPLFRLARPFGAEDKGKGKQREEEETFDEGEQEDVLFVSELPGVDKWLKRVCDVKEVAEGLTAYRYSEDKTLSYLRRKVERLAEREMFSRFLGLSRLLAKDGLVGLTDSGEEERVAGGTQVEEKVGADDEKEKARQEARLHHALSTLQPYLPPTLFTSLTCSFSPSPSIPPFPLYRAHLAALAPSTVTYTDEIEEERQAKRLQKENDKKRKAAPVSMGAKQLKKVDTSKMGKLTSFFAPKPKEEGVKKK